jgi:hypothetical protein
MYVKQMLCANCYEILCHLEKVGIIKKSKKNFPKVFQGGTMKKTR